MESQLGVGSNFSFSSIFMLTTDEEEFNLPNKKDVPKMMVADFSALLVEDDYVSGVVMRKLCEKNNVKLKVATLGKKALDILKEESFDIIFMDIQMPDISSFETTKIIREREQALNRPVPIIAITAYALAGDREKCIDAGMNDYLEKPLDVERFYAILEKHLTKEVDGSSRFVTLLKEKF